MFQVKSMRTEDFAFATELANTMDWNMAPQDFQFAKSLEPEGCFVLFDDQKAVGIATCISFGKVGWFGNLIVEEEYRKKGGGSALVNHAIDYLRSKGVETIGLYAYPHLVNFYGSLGFTFDEDFSVLHTDRLGSIVGGTLPTVGKQQISAINRFDCQCFGGERKKLLKSIVLQQGNASYYVSDGGDFIGYVSATVYERMAWIGPLICQASRHDIAISLVKAVLTKVGGKSVYAVVPKKDTILLDEFFSFKFKEDFLVSRMFFGPKVAKNCIYLAESLERG